MITELRIRGLGVIDDAVVPFAPGLTVLTGETGAGKTMVLTGLTLLMGDKADAAIVRGGAVKADVEGVWLVPEGIAADALDRVADAGGEVEADGDGSLLTLARTVAAEGRSRAFAGGRSVPAAALGEITSSLVALHGQADQLRLRDAHTQRSLLDRYAGAAMDEALTEYRRAFSQWRAVTAEVEDLVTHGQERDREAALLRHGIAEIEAVEPVVGEDDALKAQATVLANAGDLLDAVGLAHDLIAGAGFDSDDGPAARGLLADARKPIEKAAALDPALAPMVARLDDVTVLVDELGAELAEYRAAVDADPQKQATLEERRQAISALKRRYGPTLDDVLDWWRAASASVAVADGADDRIQELTAEESRLREEVVGAAAEVSRLRGKAAARLAEAVTSELHELAMADAEFSVEVTTRSGPERFGPDGADDVVMLLRPHAGTEPRPVGRGASGGELSRLMLAIEVSLAGADATPTFVFDEVDAGIGGRVAVEVGRRLARLARSAQVVVVTHLPQVAAFADRHVVVEKGSDGLVTSSSVVVVDGSDRVRELVRMLSGLEDSEAGAAHAEELLALAASEA